MESAKSRDKWEQAQALGSAFHLNTSQTWQHSDADLLQNIWRFDYAGIVVLIVTSFVPVVYYSFLCNPAFRYFYLISTVALGKTPALLQPQ